MARISKVKKNEIVVKKQKKKKKEIINFGDEFANKVESDVDVSNYIMKILTKDKKTFNIKFNQIYSDKNLVIMLKTYLSDENNPRKIYDFCKKYKIPINYYRRMKANIQNEQLLYLMELLESEDEISLWEKNDTTRKMIGMLGAQFSLKTRHGYSDTGKGNDKANVGATNIQLNFNEVPKDYVKSVNSITFEGKEFVEEKNKKKKK